MEQPVINILTRTSNRPKFFFANYLSVQDQTYPNIRHLVSYDDQDTWEYLQLYVRHKVVDALSTPRPSYKKDRFPYNLYCNKLMEEKVKPVGGWIMFLDDDDILLKKDSIEQIVNHIIPGKEGEDSLLLWKVQFPNRVIPKHLNRSPKLGDISAIGFMFHSKHIETAQWDDRQGSDYRVIHRLYKKLKPIWIDQVLTGINYQRQRSFGSGQRVDLAILTKEQQEKYNKFISAKYNHEFKEKTSNFDNKNQKNSTQTSENSITMPPKKIVATKKVPAVVKKKTVVIKPVDSKSEEPNNASDHNNDDINNNINNDNVSVNKSEDIEDILQEIEEQEEVDDTEVAEDEEEDEVDQDREQVDEEEEVDEDGEEVDEEDEVDEDGEHEEEDDGEHEEEDDGEHEEEDDGEHDEEGEDDGEDGDVEVLHPQLEKLLEMLISDEKVIILREQDLQKILFKPLKIQTHLIMKLTQKLDEIEQNLSTTNVSAPTSTQVETKKPDSLVPNTEDDRESVVDEEDHLADDRRRRRTTTSAKTGSLPSANQQLAQLKKSRNQQMSMNMTNNMQNNMHNNMLNNNSIGGERRRIRGAPPPKPKREKNSSSRNRRQLRQVGITATANIRSLRKENLDDFPEMNGENEDYEDYDDEDTFDDSQYQSQSRASRKGDMLAHPMTKVIRRQGQVVNQPSATSNRKSLRPSATNNTTSNDQPTRTRSAPGTDMAQLENLLDQYSQKTGDDATETEMADFGAKGDLDDLSSSSHMNNFFDRIYILNLTGKAQELESKFLAAGLNNYEIFDKTNPKKSLMENLHEVILNAQENQYEQILVVKDNVNVHRDICREFARQVEKLKDDWKILYLGAGMMSTTGQHFDPEFYLKTYPDLAKAGITTVQGAQSHWRSYGHREGRFGGRYLSHPAMNKDVSALALHDEIYPELVKAVNPNQKRGQTVSSNLGKLLKSVKEQTWVTVPTLFQNELTKLNKSKNRANTFLYN